MKGETSYCTSTIVRDIVLAVIQYNQQVRTHQIGPRQQMQVRRRLIERKDGLVVSVGQDNLREASRN